MVVGMTRLGKLSAYPCQSVLIRGSDCGLYARQLQCASEGSDLVFCTSVLGGGQSGGADTREKSKI